MTENVIKLLQRIGQRTGRGGKGLYMKYMNMKRFGMQLFADGDGSGADGAETSYGNGDGADENDEPMSFDDFLATEGMQAEFDRRTQKAIKTAVENAQKKWKTLIDSFLAFRSLFRWRQEQTLKSMR